MKTKPLGSQFSIGIDIPAYGYNDCAEIEIALYNERYPHRKVTFKKTDTANPIGNNSGLNATIDILVTPEHTKILGLGTVKFELKRVVNGVKQPIIKSKVPVFTIETSYTS